MPNKTYYVENPSAEQVASLYSRAEEALKVIERTDARLCIPTVNQLRYAGCHLSRYLLNGSNKEELAQAANHCKRAINDAYEAGIYFFLAEIKTFQRDYKGIVITDVLRDWLDILHRIEEIKDFIADPKDFMKEDRYRDCHDYFLELGSIIKKLNVARVELNKKITKERRQAYGILLAFISVVIAFLGYMGFGGRFTSQSNAITHPPASAASFSVPSSK